MDKIASGISIEIPLENTRREFIRAFGLDISRARWTWRYLYGQAVELHEIIYPCLRNACTRRCNYYAQTRKSKLLHALTSAWKCFMTG